VHITPAYFVIGGAKVIMKSLISAYIMFLLCNFLLQYLRIYFYSLVVCKLRFTMEKGRKYLSISVYMYTRSPSAFCIA